MKSDLELKIESLTYEVNKLKIENEQLKEELRKEKDKKESLQCRIDNELEPRLKREACSYDAWVSYDKSAEACENFVYKVDELIEMVKANPDHYAFEDRDGDTVEKILWAIKEGVYYGR